MIYGNGMFILSFCHQQKLHVTMELNTLMQKEMGEKDETIRILETKNEALRQTLDARVDELEVLKQKVSMLEEEVCDKVVCMQVTVSVYVVISQKC